MDTTSSPRQRLEDFRAFLAQPQNTDSAHYTAEIWSRGSANKGGIAGLVKRLDGRSARQEVRAQVKQLLRDNHIEITANIRKALPSRTAPGDAAALSQLLDAQALPLQVNDLASLAPHLQFEIEKLATTTANGKTASVTDFLLQGSGPARQALLALLRPALQERADDMAAQAFDAFARGLMFGRSIDESMDKAFQTLREQYASQKAGDGLGNRFGDAIQMISGLLQSVDGTAFAAEARKSLAPSLMLAAFMPVLSDALEKRQPLFQMAVQDFCTVRDAQPEPQEPNPTIEERAKTVIDSGQLWRLNPASLADRLAAAIQSSLLPHVADKFATMSKPTGETS